MSRTGECRKLKSRLDFETRLHTYIDNKQRFLSYYSPFNSKMLRTVSRITRFAIGAKKIANSASALRSFATSSSKAPPSLSSVLTRELEYEKEEGSASSEAAMNEIRSELKEWTFLVEAQKARFSLSKKFGAQEVRVDVDCTPMPAEEDEGGEDEANEAADGQEEEEPADGYRMLVTIKDPSKTSTMQVGCFLGSSLRIHRVTLFPAGKEPSADIVFGGVSISQGSIREE